MMTLSDQRLLFVVGTILVSACPVAAQDSQSVRTATREALPAIEQSSGTSWRIEELQEAVAQLKNEVRFVQKLLQRNDGVGNAREALSVLDATSSDESSEEVSVIRVAHIDLDDAQDVMQSVVGPEGRVTQMVQTNTLVAIAPAGQLRRAIETLAKIDVPRPQVRISAQFFEIPIAEIEALKLTNHAEARPRQVTEVVLDKIRQSDGTKLLARPQLQAYAGTVSSFRAVSEIPVQQLTQTGAGEAIGTTEFREAGISLTVAPQVTANGEIVLMVEPSVSRVRGFTGNQPIIDRRSARTTVQLQDGSSVMLGGIHSRPLEPLPGDADVTDEPETELLIVIHADIVGT